MQSLTVSLCILQVDVQWSSSGQVQCENGRDECTYSETQRKQEVERLGDPLNLHALSSTCWRHPFSRLLRMNLLYLPFNQRKNIVVYVCRQYSFLSWAFQIVYWRVILSSSFVWCLFPKSNASFKSIFKWGSMFIAPAFWRKKQGNHWSMENQLL